MESEWAALADALLHEEGAPCAISHFVVDGPRLFVEEGGEGGNFEECICNDFEELYGKNHVCHVFLASHVFFVRK